MANNTRIEASIIIEASPEQIWSVLTDFKNLSKWSSSFQNLSGDFTKDGLIEVVFKSPLGGDTKMNKKLFLFEEQKSFGWTGTFMMGMKDYHTHTLKGMPNGTTKFIQTDKVSGGISFLLGKVLEKQMKKGYNIFNKELKTYVEAKFNNN